VISVSSLKFREVNGEKMKQHIRGRKPNTLILRVKYLTTKENTLNKLAIDNPQKKYVPHKAAPQFSAR
jgi:hypothetical protein